MLAGNVYIKGMTRMFLLWSCVRYVAMLSVTEGARGQTVVILVNLCHLRPASFKNHHPIRPALSNTQALSLPHLTHCMKVEMNSPQPTNKPRESAVHTTPPMLTQRQRLRAIVDRHADLLDPPTTAEAFALLEAAMDEANQHSSTDSDITGQNDMLDPPNTAERFARIEAAMDAVFSKSVNTTWTQRHRKKSKFEMRVPVQPTHSQGQTRLGNQIRDNDKSSTLALQQGNGNSRDGPANETGGLAEQVHAFASTSTTHGSKLKSQHSDIFRSSVAVDEFADKAYQSAREKYS